MKSIDVVAGPKSCPDDYCQNFYEDVITTMKVCMDNSTNSNVDPIFANTNFSKTGVYGHSMGGAATSRVCNEKDLNLVGCGLLHPSITDDFDRNNEAKDMKHPSLWFTGSSDSIVPPDTVWKYYNEDPIIPKACGELKGKTHFYPSGDNTNVEANYLAQFFACFISGDQNGCDYVFGKTNGLCEGGESYTQCVQNGTVSQV